MTGRPKTFSVGFVIMCPSGMLLGHTTGSDHWDVPKGGIDEGETPLQGATRELSEETGLTFDGNTLRCKFSGESYPVVSIKALGRHSYTKHKDLELFKLEVSTDIIVNALKCESMVERPNYSFPELDRFVLAQGGLHKLLTPALYEWLKAHM